MLIYEWDWNLEWKLSSVHKVFCHDKKRGWWKETWRRMRDSRLMICTSCLEKMKESSTEPIPRNTSAVKAPITLGVTGNPACVYTSAVIRTAVSMSPLKPQPIAFTWNPKQGYVIKNILIHGRLMFIWGCFGFFRMQREKVFAHSEMCSHRLSSAVSNHSCHLQCRQISYDLQSGLFSVASVCPPIHRWPV